MSKKVDLNLTAQRDNIIAEIRKKLKLEKFSMERRKTVQDTRNSQLPMMDDEKRQFDESCAICMSNYSQMEEVVMTPCRHTFHEECLMGWLKAKAEESLKTKVQKESRNEKVDIEEIGPQCPNCQASLLKAVAIEEQAARDNLADVLNLMTSSADLQSENVLPVISENAVQRPGEDSKEHDFIDPAQI